MEADKQKVEESQPSDMRKMIEKNLELTEEIHKMTKSIKTFTITQRIFGIIKILIIVIPIILGIIYLPPLFSDLRPMFNDALNTYRELLGLKTRVDTSEKFDPSIIPSLSPEVLAGLKQQICQ